MSARELMAAALCSSHLEHSAIGEMPVDRIGAFAHGEPLGRLLWRWKYAGQDLRVSVMASLLAYAMSRYQIPMRHPAYMTLQRVCRQALMEYYSPECQACCGAREVMAGSLKIVCTSCDGVGVRKYEDEERIKAIEVSPQEYSRVWEKRLHDLLITVNANDGGTGAEVNYQLERS